MSVNLSIHGHGKPLVLLHGWGFDAQIWSPLLPLLMQQYRLYLVDLPGFGLTSPMDWEEFKLNLLKHLPQQFAIAGWSLGGLFATRLAIEKPQCVTHLINIASSPRFIRDTNWPGVDAQVFRRFYLDLANDPQKTLRLFIELQLQGHVLSGVEGHPATIEGLRAGLDVLVSWDLI